jgi:pimeloyl-ACP methyl ester carboxylesterase
VITFDRRSVGISDRVASPSLEDRMDDVRAVLDDVGSRSAVLFGVS